MPINKPFKPLLGSLDNNVVILSGRVAIGATGAVGAQTGGVGVTVTRTATGDYTLTLAASNGVPAILFAVCDLEEDGDVGYVVQTRVVSASAGTATYTVVLASAPTTPADPPSGSFLQFLVAIRHSSVTR